MGNHLKHTRLFHLKPFSLSHHNSSMRVGTDAMLLGLFVDATDSKNTLEIGTGSGIISLLLASRSNTRIDAIDMDKNSVREANSNFERSPFYQRLNATHADFKEYSTSFSDKYDLIVSNPPFFINDFRPNDEVKKAARHTDSLTYKQICNGVNKLLNPSGRLYLVLPYDESKFFLQVAINKGLYLQQQQIIIPKRSLPPNRVNLQFGFNEPVEKATTKFIIREDNGNFTRQYIDYLKDYYISLK